MRRKRLTITFVVMLMIAFVSPATYAQYGRVMTPREPSPAAMVSQTVGISSILVKYSRPSVKGREIWGKLVPYGWNVQPFGAGNSAPWRAGANENTVIELSNNAKIEGHDVPAGSYGLSFVINKDNTGEVILSKDYKSWGSFFYDPKNDEMRANIQLRDIPMTEMLTYDFINDTKTSAELALNWEKKQFPVKIEFDVDKIVMDNAVKELNGAVGFNDIGFSSAAAYALQNNLDLDQALKWADQAILQRPIFNNYFLKSGILKQMGKTTEADKVINDALTNNATNLELNIYGYQLLNAKNYDKAIEVLTIDTKRFSNDPNTFDSLGEAYALKGDKKNAIINFKKSLSMNPNAATKANSEKYLQQLGGM